MGHVLRNALSIEPPEPMASGHPFPEQAGEKFHARLLKSLFCPKLEFKADTGTSLIAPSSDALQAGEGGVISGPKKFTSC